MYHLFTEKEQKQALCEAVRVTKKEGMIFVAYCGNDATIINFCFKKNMINTEPYTSLIDPVTFKAASTPEELFVLYRKEDIEALTKDLPVERLNFIGTDMAANYMSDIIDKMDEKTFAKFLDYHFYICERSDMVGVSNHFLDIMKKTSK